MSSLLKFIRLHPVSNFSLGTGLTKGGPFVSSFSKEKIVRYHKLILCKIPTTVTSTVLFDRRVLITRQEGNIEERIVHQVLIEVYTILTESEIQSQSYFRPVSVGRILL